MAGQKFLSDKVVDVTSSDVFLFRSCKDVCVKCKFSSILCRRCHVSFSFHHPSLPHIFTSCL